MNQVSKHISAISTFLILSLTGCSTCLTCQNVVGTATSPTLGINKKSPTYVGVVKKLSVFILEPNFFASSSLAGQAPSPQAKKSGDAAIASLEAALNSSLVPFLNTRGLSSELATSAEKSSVVGVVNPAGSTHLLVISANQVRTQCRTGCQSTVVIKAVLTDAKSGALAWDGYLSVPEVSVFGSLGERDVQQVGDLILSALKENSLVSEK